MDHLRLLDTVLDYINEHGLYTDLIEHMRMYDEDTEAFEEAVENRYNN